MDDGTNKDKVKWHRRLSDKVKKVLHPADGGSDLTVQEVEETEKAKAITTQNANGSLHISIQDEEVLFSDSILAQVASDKQQEAELMKVSILPPPTMTICILVVGTQGDVQPFIGLGKRLQKDGHRVRLATHAIYRKIVTSHKLEFYPLGGDPKELAAYMVKTGGQLLPTGLDAITKDIPRNMEIIEEILLSTWPAVSQPDPNALGEGVCGEPFTANAIISNPVTYGHIHVAEKLGVPLHIMFPQPWVPTKYFPHPLSNLPCNGQVLLRNFVSYKAVDAFMWAGVEGMVNRFRKEVLNLRKIRRGESGRNILLDLEIPHAFMWSSALVPKPPDWGPKYDVVGTLLMDDLDAPIQPFDAPVALKTFLQHSAPPVFIGFGSMVMPDPSRVTRMIVEAAVQSNTRVVLQSSWSEMAGEVDIPESVFLLGSCPHDWLMPQMAAVIHHGGAGTTAAGLLAGKPTFICPFFGDQPFWGHAVYSAGVGVKPCPIVDLTVDKLKSALTQLTSDELAQAAQKLSQRMRAEDGVGEAVRCFYKHLPIDNMVCDLDPSRVATRWSVEDNLKLSDVAEYAIMSRAEYHDKTIIPYHSVDYSARGPMCSLDGIRHGAGAFVHEVGGGFKDLIAKPARGFREEGAKGAALGVFKGIGGLIVRPMHGMILWADKVATGHHNRHRKTGEGVINSRFDERLRTAFLAEETYKKGGVVIEGKMRLKERNIVSIRLTNAEKNALKERFEALMQSHTIASNDDIRSITAATTSTPPRASPVHSECSSSDEGEAASAPRTGSWWSSSSSSSSLSTEVELSVQSAFYKSDGTIKIDFSGEKDEISDRHLEQLRQVAQAESIKAQEILQARRKAHIPRMNICILIVGTRDDVQPFIALGTRLKQDGHRVRLATHAVFRDFVTEYDLEFYPLGGDPKILAAYMVKTPGQLLPTGYTTVTKDLPQNMKMIEEILFSTWPAVSAADPDANGKGKCGLEFRADAIISNPVTYGHIHVAEKLGCPLHMMLPQPWVPTRAFPHPLSNLPYDKKWRRSNYLSYKVVDVFMWQGTESMVNRFRLSLNLDRIRLGDGGQNLVSDLRIPHAFTCSPALVAKPCDWGHEVDITGRMNLKQKQTKPYDDPPEGLVAFLEAGPPPVLIGFGSMMMDNPVKLTVMIVEAASQANVRVIVQSSWSDMAGDSGICAENVFMLGPCPHDWLMPRMSAVIHHGGTGTTAVGLQAGKPTFICPFFGDQPFWGQAVLDAGVGIAPVPISSLTVDILASALIELHSDELQQKAKELADVMNSEDGVENALHAFYAHLPVEVMMCDVDPKRLARIYDPKLQLKLSYEADMVIRSIPEHSSTEAIKYKPLQYSRQGPRYSLEALASGARAFAFEVGSAIKAIYAEPCRGYHLDGTRGAMKGVGKPLAGLVVRPLNGAALWADKVATGASNYWAHNDKKTDSVVYQKLSKLFKHASLAEFVVEAPDMGSTEEEEQKYKQFLLSKYEESIVARA